MLVSLGDSPWRGPRPVLVPVLAVHGRKPPAYLLSADEAFAAEQRTAFERLAGETGLAVTFPPAAEFTNWGVAIDAVTDTDRCGPDGTIVVRGTLDWNEAALGWVGSWRACWNGKAYHWAIQGVGYDLAFANIVEGVALLASGRGSPDLLPVPAR